MSRQFGWGLGLTLAYGFVVAFLVFLLLSESRFRSPPTPTLNAAPARMTAPAWPTTVATKPDSKP